MTTLNLEVLATPNQMANPNNTDGWLASKPNSLTWSSQRHDFPWESKRRWVESRGGSNSRVKVGVEELIADPFVCLRQLQQVSQPHPNGMRHALVWSTWHGIATWRLHNNHHSWTAKDLPLHWQHSGSLLLVKQSTPTTGQRNYKRQKKRKKVTQENRLFRKGQEEIRCRSSPLQRILSMSPSLALPTVLLGHWHCVATEQQWISLLHIMTEQQRISLLHNVWCTALQLNNWEFHFYTMSNVLHGNWTTEDFTFMQCLMYCIATKQQRISLLHNVWCTV